MAERLRFALPLLFTALVAASASAQPYIYAGGDFFYGHEGVAVFDTRSEQALARRTIPGCDTGNVAFRPGSTELFVTCRNPDFPLDWKIVVVDPSTFQVTASILVPDQAWDLAFTPDG